MKNTAITICFFVIDPTTAKHLESVDVLLNHLTAVLACKEQILNQLQSRSAETSLQVEGTFHK